MSKKEKKEREQAVPQEEAEKDLPETEPEAGEQEAKGEETGKDPLEELQDELNKQKDMLLRTAAEYENFRKRTEKEKRAIYADATAEAVKAILPIADSLEYAVKAQDGATEGISERAGDDPEPVQRVAGKAGGFPVGEAGEEFNPEIHNAVAHIEDETVAENTIVEVFQKGLC